ncbi:alcohol dehydrogenase catalytic domain-containing protein [Rhodococcus fascians]|nr:alcohol dehydrogenase catalytic domain-containing protein [Rhodococcus fascians]MBY4237844.1 alcohol dehydrogenase catalytic domain-containing protein [Rhodococcus fascians]MBY4253405.1 alcohol dehydrogenase catalytic domain-containing protein [Rhodococcus fascians]MBY4269042.1 alcohol dehydrogenase catalytic domain-containing protein [Rhodococcus fascians]MBY4275095.1 alcohol dehydrogenase catalytic domain-containing protein [Rhodococcus fascians]
MRAVQLTEWGAAPQFREVADPSPQGEELILQVDATGLCRSDLHVMKSAADRFDYALPLTLGHEVAGSVIDVGPKADRSWIGQAVVVHGIWSCRQCRNCVRGRENYCLELAARPDGRLAPIGNGLGRAGGLAERMVVPSSAVLVPIGTLDPRTAAPLADAALTAYHVIRTNTDLVDNRSVVVVVGVGGLGHLALQVLRSLGVPHIIAVEIRPEAHALAAQSGAHACYATLDAASEHIADLGGADLVFDFVGAPVTVEPGPGVLASGGRLVVVGGAGGRLTVGKDLRLPTGWQVSAPFWGTMDDLRAVIALAREGSLHAEITAFPFDETLLAYQRLESNSITGRAVVDMTASRRPKEEAQQ